MSNDIMALETLAGTNAREFKTTGDYLTSADNLDTFYGNDKAGVYFIGGTTPENAPGTVSWSMLLVFTRGSFTYQILFKGTGGIYVRRYVGSPSTWSGWYYAALTAY